MAASLADAPGVSTLRRRFAPNLHNSCDAAASPKEMVGASQPGEFMSDAAADVPSPGPAPTARGPNIFRRAYKHVSGSNLLSRAILLGILTLALKIPLGLVGGVIDDRQAHESEATRKVTESWGSAQIFTGPMMVLPFKRFSDGRDDRTLTLLPEKLSIDGLVKPEQRQRGLFAVNVYTATLDVVAEFQLKAIREYLIEGRRIDWTAVRLNIGLTDPKAISAATLDVDGQQVEWNSGLETSLATLPASLGSIDLANRETVTVRIRISFGGSACLSLAPIGRRTDATLASSWPSPSFVGRYLPVTQAIDKDGFQAKWSTSNLGRRYGQLWDSGNGTEPAAGVVADSAFGFALYNPVDAYRQTDRAIKYGVMFIGLTFAACLMFEMVTGTRPLVTQYGLIGLSLCVFYLLLLSTSEQIGFAPAYLASAAAVVVQATIYNWALYRRRGAALAFGAVLTGLYAGLYGLLRLEDVALLGGSVLLFAVLSLAMWLTRNLHRTQPA
jgi:inner membrane protein